MQRFNQESDPSSTTQDSKPGLNDHQNKQVLVKKSFDGQKRIDIQKDVVDLRCLNMEETKKNTTQPPAGAAEGAAKKIKCKHFPHCMNMETCPFFHPTEKCKYFPACSNGDKCLYLHPEIDCKYGIKCTRQNCAYTHPKGRANPAVKFGATNNSNM